MKIYSKINKNEVLHIIKTKDLIEGREDLVDDDQFIQVSCSKLNKGHNPLAHKHLSMHRTSKITQESWIVIQGKLLAKYYDADNSFIKEVILYPGDCSITLKGGHTYEVLEDDTIIYENKLGPYFGRNKDKVNI